VDAVKTFKGLVGLRIRHCALIERVLGLILWQTYVPIFLFAD
jgi:hypothetical protein